MSTSVNVATEAHAAARPDGPRMTDVMHQLARITLWVAGLAAFGTAVALLLLTPAGRSWPDWLAVAIPALVWSLGLLPRLAARRALIQILAGALLLASPLAIAPSGAPGYIVVTTVAFATIFPAVMAFEVRGALVTTFGVTALLALVIAASPPGADLSGDPVDGVVSLLFCLAMGLGLTLTRAQWFGYAMHLDTQREALREVEEQDRREREHVMARAAVERRIHETVLNTFSALSFGVTPADRDKARASCRRDLEQLELGLNDVRAATLREIIDNALDTLASEHLQCHIALSVNEVIPATTASSLRDAIVESLRNVIRHSGGSEAWITATLVGDMLDVRIRDAGVGIRPDAVERFGVRNALRSGMVAVGGTAELVSEPGKGTTVILRAPIPAVTVLPEPEAVAGIVGVSRLGRVGLLGGNAVFLLAALPISAPMGIAAFVVPAAVVIFLLNMALALQWNTRWRLPLAVASIGVSLAIMVAAALSDPGCAVWPRVNWIVGLLCGSMAALAFFAPRSQLGRGLMIVATTAGGLVLVAQLPSACRTGPFISTATSAAYLIGLWILLQWSETQFAEDRARADATWERIVAVRVATARQEAVVAGWTQVGAETRDLLNGIAFGNLDPCDATVRMRAAMEAATIRERLGLGVQATSGFDRLVRRLTAVATTAGASIDAETVTALTRVELPAEAICLALERIVRASTGDVVVLRALELDGEEDIVVTASAQAIDVSGLRLEPTPADDCEVSVLDDDADPTLVRVIVTRPSEAAATMSS